MKKLLDSDWLRAVQFKCNIVILDYDLLKVNEKFFRQMISCKATTKILYGNSEKSFLQCEKSFKKHLPALFWLKFFHVCIINK